MEVNFTFAAVAAGVSKIFILTFLGYLFYRIKLVDDPFVDKLSQILVKVIFPSLIISKTITNFSFSEFSFWWLLPLLAAVFSLSGMAIGAFALKARPLKAFKSKREFMSSAGFQNSGYLPMNLIIFLFAGAVADKLLIYLFLFLVGFDFLTWSFMPLFLTGGLRKNFRPSMFLNPPVLSPVFSLIWVAVFGKNSMPSVIMEPLRQLGGAAFPIAMLTLGMFLARYRAHVPEQKTPVILNIAIKLGIFPLIILLILMSLNVSPDLRFLLFLQAVMPTAVSLVFISAYAGGNNRFLSSVIFYSHLVSIITIPLWFLIYNIVFIQ